jgi:hypothetical protein
MLVPIEEKVPVGLSDFLVRAPSWLRKVKDFTSKVNIAQTPVNRGSEALPPD